LKKLAHTPRRLRFQNPNIQPTQVDKEHSGQPEFHPPPINYRSEGKVLRRQENKATSTTLTFLPKRYEEHPT
jgi:hypothetical protein